MYEETETLFRTAKSVEIRRYAQLHIIVLISLQKYKTYIHAHYCIKKNRSRRRRNFKFDERRRWLQRVYYILLHKGRFSSFLLSVFLYMT